MIKLVLSAAFINSVGVYFIDNGMSVQLDSHGLHGKEKACSIEND